MKFLVRKHLLYRSKIYRPGETINIADNDTAKSWQENEVICRHRSDDADPSSDLTITEIKTQLGEKGIPYKPGMKKKDLMTLLNGDSS